VTALSKATVTQLDATPTSWLATTYDVRGGTAGLARLRVRWTSGEASLRIGSRRYRWTRVGRPGGPWRMERRGHPVALAHDRSLLAPSFAIRFAGQRYELRARPGRRAFRVERNGRAIGAIEPVAWYSRHARLTVREGLPEELAYFLVFLVLASWQTHLRWGRMATQMLGPTTP